MELQYTMSIDHITEENLTALFKAVEWESAKFPEQLVEAIKGSHTVITAWDGNRLVGLANALSDGALTAYFHYVLVDPTYHGKGIGKEMMQRMLKKYSGFQTKVLISYPNVVDFYEKLGFTKEDGPTPMYISDLI
jgi:GNAT superfamily N-acetyltransferase